MLKIQAKNISNEDQSLTNQVFEIKYTVQIPAKVISNKFHLLNGCLEDKSIQAKILKFMTFKKSKTIRAHNLREFMKLINNFKDRGSHLKIQFTTNQILKITEKLK